VNEIMLGTLPDVRRY